MDIKIKMRSDYFLLCHVCRSVIKNFIEDILSLFAIIYTSVTLCRSFISELSIQIKIKMTNKQKIKVFAFYSFYV